MEEIINIMEWKRFVWQLMIKIIIMIFNFGTVLRIILRKNFEKMRKWKFSKLFSILINAEKTLKIPTLRNEISPYVKPINEVLRKFFLSIENSHSFSQYYEKPLETQDFFNETTFFHWESFSKPHYSMKFVIMLGIVNVSIVVIL